jgi:predicted XRE-type DNA-binding protein
MKNTTKKKVNVIASRGNVFADLMLPEAEDRLLKAQLALKIQQLIGQKEMTQAEIAPSWVSTNLRYPT